ncbi:MAG TPA: hypothetical protein VJN92_14320 [Candidatus Acidoferrum sp.]|nr:hypothetical protein [Candidatus Acidoferrum sp.]
MSNTIKKLAGPVGRLLLAYLLVFAQCVWAGQGQESKDRSGSGAKQAAASQSPTAAAKTSAAEEETAAAENRSSKQDSHRGGQHEGIQVHGHWTIEVHNSDGTFATHREFENSLAGGGSFVLSTVLARTNSVGLWQINLGGANGGPCPGSANAGDCIIQENGSPITGASIFNGLTVTTTTGAGGLNILQLSGSAPTGSGQITKVQTFLNACPGGGCAPSTSGGSVTAGYLFTQAVISPINVISGQTVAVTVVISFS